MVWQNKLIHKCRWTLLDTTLPRLTETLSPYSSQMNLSNLAIQMSSYRILHKPNYTLI